MGRIDPRQGGSMIYVVMLMTMFAILSTGFLYMSRYSMEAVLQNRSYMEAQATAKMIHQSYCLDVSNGSSAAMNRIWEEFEEDCLSLAGRRGAAELTEALEALEYRANGYGETGDLAVEMVLTARPARGEATVDTQVTWHGYTFRLGAEIRFDQQAQTPYFSYLAESGVTHEVWFEDARSSYQKLLLIQEYGFRGVGYWNYMRPFTANFSILNVLYRIRNGDAPALS